jgi:uncharacterized protein (DUF4415 family)
MRKTTERKLFQPTEQAQVVPKNRRTVMPPESRAVRNIKVRTNIHLDLDLIHFFKQRANAPGAAPYQTQINAALREFVESAVAEGPDAITNLRHAKGLIDAALRKIS